MPVITVQMWSGRTGEQKAALAEAITNAMVEIAGNTREKVNVIFQNVDQENWAIGGELSVGRPHGAKKPEADSDARRAGAANPRILHAALRFRDLDAAEKFYVDTLGFGVRSKEEFRDGQPAIITKAGVGLVAGRLGGRARPRRLRGSEPRGRDRAGRGEGVEVDPRSAGHAVRAVDLHRGSRGHGGRADRGREVVVPPDDGVRWSDLTIAIVGGDDREQVIARLAAETGAEVRAFGFPWPEGGIPGVTASKSAAEAIEGARYALFPIPGLQDGKLFAEGTSEPIHPDEELLSRLAPGALIIGNSDDAMDECAGRLGIPVDNYEGDEELMRLRAPAIVEGAISIAVQNTDRTLHMSEIAVVGFGNMGRQVAQTLLALRASVHVVARNPLQRAAAYALGAQPAPLEELRGAGAGDAGDLLDGSGAHRRSDGAQPASRRRRGDRHRRPAGQRRLRGGRRAGGAGGLGSGARQARSGDRRALAVVRDQTADRGGGGRAWRVLTRRSSRS